MSSLISQTSHNLTTNATSVVLNSTLSVTTTNLDSNGTIATTIETTLNETIPSVVSAISSNSTISVGNSSISSSNIDDPNTDFSLILLGYVCIIILMSAWLFSTCFKPLGRASKFMFIFAKVLIILAIETIVFPILIGYLLDYWLNKEVLGLEWKIVSILIHWVFGLGYMFSFATLVGWLNKILRPGVLWFFRNPNDPDFDLLREIVNIPALKHVRRIAMSILLYIFLISTFIGLPVAIARFVSVFLI